MRNIIVSEGATFVCTIKLDGTTRPQRRNFMKTFVDDEFEADMQPPFQICFGEGEPFGAAAIVESLVWLCNEVERACTSIAEAHSADLQSGAA